MKKIFLILLASITICNLYAYNTIKASGIIVEETRDLKNFTNVKVSGGIITVIQQDDNYKVLVKADKNLIEYVNTDVNGNTLNISFKNMRNLNFLEFKESVYVYVSAPNITGLSCSSASKMEINTLKCNDINISCSSSGKIELKDLICDNAIINASSSSSIKGGIKCKNDMTVKTSSASNIQINGSTDRCNASASSASNIKMDLNTRICGLSTSSASKIEVQGKAENCTASTSSASKILLDNFICENVVAEASSGSMITTNVNNALTANVSSAGNVKYKGNPEKLIVKKSSGGSVKKY